MPPNPSSAKVTAPTLRVKPEHFAAAKPTPPTSIVQDPPAPKPKAGGGDASSPGVPAAGAGTPPKAGGGKPGVAALIILFILFILSSPGQATSTSFIVTNDLGGLQNFTLYSVSAGVYTLSGVTGVATNSHATLTGTGTNWAGVLALNTNNNLAAITSFNAMGTNPAQNKASVLLSLAIHQIINLGGASAPSLNTNSGGGGTNTSPGFAPAPVSMWTGTNNPNGLITSGLGSLYEQYDVTGTNFLRQWVKTTPIGTAGWALAGSNPSGNGAGLTNMVVAGFNDPTLNLALASMNVYGAADMGATSHSSRGILTCGNMANQRIIGAFGIPGYQNNYNLGPAQPEPAIRYVNGVEYRHVDFAQFVPPSIWMTNFYFDAWTRDLVNWTVTMEDPLNPTNASGFWNVVSNYFASYGYADPITNYTVGQPSNVTDYNNGTNYSLIGICPIKNSVPQITVAIPWLDANCTQLGNPQFMNFLANSGDAFFDASVFHGIGSNWFNGQLCEVVVRGGANVQILTNSANSMSSTNWVVALNGMPGLQTQGGTNIIGTNSVYYWERPFIRGITYFGKPYYFGFGNFTQRTNGIASTNGIGPSFNGISWSTDGLNWNPPVTNSCMAYATNSLGESLYVNGLKFCDAPYENFPFSSGNEGCFLPVTRSDGVQGMAYYPAMTQQTFTNGNLAAFATNGHFTVWLDGSQSAVTTLGNLTMKAITSGGTNTAGLTVTNEGGANGGFMFQYQQNGNIAYAARVLSDGTIEVGTTGLNYKGGGFYVAGTDNIEEAGPKLVVDNGLYINNGSFNMLSGLSSAPPINTTYPNEYLRMTNSSGVTEMIPVLGTNVPNRIPGAVTLGASPFNFTNTLNWPLQLDISGATAFSVAVNGVTVFNSLTGDYSRVLMQTNIVTITYTVAPLFSTNSF